MKYLLILSLISYAICQQDVTQLQGHPGFRSMRLMWRYPNDISSNSVGFRVNYCELQAWGRHRCKRKMLEDPINNEVPVDEQRSLKAYELELKGLRMATNYTIEVAPFYKDGSMRESRSNSIGSELRLQTKGFSAKAINCLANTSLVEVETGPNFGGKISVEGSVDDRCSTEGDFSSKTTYLLTINHYLCGSTIFNTSVRTFIIVQENLPILTHSTRRFMVVCSYIPETFTVRAGVNLPDEAGEPDVLVPVGQDINEVDPSELFDSTNQLFSNARLDREVGRALKFSSTNEKEEPRRWSHLVLMVVMILSALVGMIVAVWQVYKRTRSLHSTGSSNDSSVMSDGSESGGVYCSADSYIHPELYPGELSDMEVVNGFRHNNLLAMEMEGAVNVEIVPELYSASVPMDDPDLVLDPISLTDFSTPAIPYLVIPDEAVDADALLPELPFADDYDLQQDILESIAQNNLAFQGSQVFPTFQNSLVPAEENTSLKPSQVRDSLCAVVTADNNSKDKNWQLKNKKGDVFVLDDEGA